MSAAPDPGPDLATGPAGPILQLADLHKTWDSNDRRFTLAVPDLTLARGEIVSLTGESGSGKSTLLEMVGLVSRPDGAARFMLDSGQGAVDVDAVYASGNARLLARLRAMAVGYVVQTGALLPFLTMAQNIRLPLRLTGRADGGQTAHLIQTLGLSGLEGAYPAALSIGQRQRTAIARSLVHRPPLILADEPTAALDPANKAVVIDLLVELAQTQGATVIVATHERDLLDRPGVRHLHVSTELGQTDGLDHVHAIVGPGHG
ncbi:MAG: ATP-binding cassette domain-containing protein [Pseudomonadota bacterium]